ncbi:LUD domain-containing protein [Haloarchaeobius sp. HRN-SO-5]|uniref:LUD domain-containing protein n=1 Tax=Haloarchaeobius sp. HRN-SO-5 TaxID=3446118 RepID=UPI003EBC6F90
MTETDDFVDALDGLGVTSDRTTLDGLEATLERAVDRPAVGVPLHVDADLPSAVETTFTPAELRDAATGVTPARLGIAEFGSVLVRSTAGGDEPVSLYPERHVAVLDAADVVATGRDAVDWLAEEVAAGRDSYVLATGASATADMGGLVEGVHGPNSVHVVVVEDEEGDA